MTVTATRDPTGPDQTSRLRALPVPAAALALLAIAGFAAGTVNGWVGLRLFTKPVPVLVLAFAAWRAAAGARPASSPGAGYAGGLSLGLALSAIGDILLEQPSGFLPGLVAFLLAHLVYVFVFTLDLRRLAPLPALPGLAWGASYYAFLLPGLKAMAVPVGVYVVVICCMLWRALARLSARGRSGQFAALGALFFVASDSMLAWNRFHQPFAAASWAVIATYWLGQAGIAASAWQSAYSGEDSSSGEGASLSTR